jgi:hypothetical protein
MSGTLAPRLDLRLRSAECSARTSLLTAFGSVAVGAFLAEQPGEHATLALAALTWSEFCRESHEVLIFRFAAQRKTPVRQVAEITDPREVRGCCHVVTLGAASQRFCALPCLDSGLLPHGHVAWHDWRRSGPNRSSGLPASATRSGSEHRRASAVREVAVRRGA